MQSTVIPSTVNSIHFLWAAYIIVIVANVGHVGWLISTWAKLNKPKR
jgi:hypothetical protein